MSEKKRLFVLSSPSGGGKSTVARFLLKKYPKLKFSISATTRPRRRKETHGKDYYFYSLEEFKRLAGANSFIEYEEIFGNFYGTLQSVIQKALDNNDIMIFDVDVKGAMSLKSAFPEESLTIFLAPPNMQTLEKRLRRRSTETEEQVAARLARSMSELEMSKNFDYIVVNDVLDKMLEEVDEIIKKHLP